MKQTLDLPGGDTKDLDPFAATPLTAPNSNSRLGGFQKTRKERDERFVCTILHGGSAQLDFQRALSYPGNLIVVGTRLHTYQEGDGSTLLVLG